MFLPNELTFITIITTLFTVLRHLLILRQLSIITKEQLLHIRNLSQLLSSNVANSI